VALWDSPGFEPGSIRLPNYWGFLDE